jgi:hypothetical protein
LKRAKIIFVLSFFVLSSFALQNPTGTGQPQVVSTPAVPTQIFGFRDFSKQYKVDQEFMASPSPARAEQHLKILTALPHIAGSPEDKATADHMAKHFDIAGMETEMVKYSVWMNRPSEISVVVTAPANVKMNGPRPEHVDGDPLADNPRVVMPFNGSSPSGDAEAEVVYANYGRPEDFKKLEELKVDVKGKIVIVRYGDNFRGVKSFVAEEHGAAAVIIYSDPIDDGYLSEGTVASGERSAARVGAVHVQISGRSDDTGICFRGHAAGVATRAAGTSGRHAQDSHNATLVWRRASHPGEPGGT